MAKQSKNSKGSGSSKIRNWVPFRPEPADLERLAREVEVIASVQAELHERAPDLAFPDRVAHQYQIAGGRAELVIDESPPEPLRDVGLFVPAARHVGLFRISTGLGVPHLETDPDFLGLMLAFRTPAGRRVDFLGINDPAAPSANHRDFLKLVEATVAGAGVEAPFGSGLGARDLLDLAVSQTMFAKALVKKLGFKDGLTSLAHIVTQTLKTATSSTAYQTYWTGVVETSLRLGKFIVVPTRDENGLPSLQPGERYLTEEWRERQRRGPIGFELYFTPYVDPDETPLDPLTKDWTEHRQLVGALTLPQQDADAHEARLFSALATEMGANPGNWVHDRTDSIRHPATEFTVARKLAYQKSQQGRGVLPDEAYAECFVTGKIGPALAAELERRIRAKDAARHVDSARRA